MKANLLWAFLSFITPLLIPPLCTGCQLQLNFDSCDSKTYRAVYDYVRNDSTAREYYQSTFLDSGRFAILVADTLIPFRTHYFLDTVAVLRFGGSILKNQRLLVAQRREEVDRNRTYRGSGGIIDGHRIIQGVGPEAFLRIHLSAIHSGVVPGYEMLRVKVTPNLTEAQDLALRMRGTSTNRWLEYLFVIRECRIEQVFVTEPIT